LPRTYGVKMRPPLGHHPLSSTRQLSFYLSFSVRDNPIYFVFYCPLSYYYARRYPLQLLQSTCLVCRSDIFYEVNNDVLSLGLVLFPLRFLMDSFPNAVFLVFQTGVAPCLNRLDPPCVRRLLWAPPKPSARSFSDGLNLRL